MCIVPEAHKAIYCLSDRQICYPPGKMELSFYQSSQHMNHHLPAGISYQLTTSWQICTSWQILNCQQPSLRWLTYIWSDNLLFIRWLNSDWMIYILPDKKAGPYVVDKIRGCWPMRSWWGIWMHIVGLKIFRFEMSTTIYSYCWHFYSQL